MLTSAACGGGRVGRAATPEAAPGVIVIGGTFNKFGWSIAVPASEKVIEKGLGADTPDDSRGTIEWGDAFKGGLVKVLWLAGSNRDNYNISAGLESIANSYVQDPVVGISNISAIKREVVNGLDVDYKTYEISYFNSPLQGVTTAHQCSGPDKLIFINVIASKSPLEKADVLLTGFKCGL